MVNREWLARDPKEDAWSTSRRRPTSVGRRALPDAPTCATRGACGHAAPGREGAMSNAQSRAPSLLRTSILVGGACALLASAPLAAEALAETTVERDGDVVTAIRGLELGNAVYDVEFVNRTAGEVYGDPPVFDADSSEEAYAAALAVTEVLNAEAGITGVGESAATAAELFQIGFGVESANPSLELLRLAVIGSNPAHARPSAAPSAVRKSWGNISLVP